MLGALKSHSERYIFRSAKIPGKAKLVVVGGCRGTFSWKPDSERCFWKHFVWKAWEGSERELLSTFCAAGMYLPF